MRFNFSFGKRFGWDRLTPEQRAVIERLERGEISDAEAERLLGPGADVRVSTWTAGDTGGDERRADPEPPQSTDDAKAQEMIERIAREVDEETRG